MPPNRSRRGHHAHQVQHALLNAYFGEHTVRCFVRIRQPQDSTRAATHHTHKSYIYACACMPACPRRIGIHTKSITNFSGDSSAEFAFFIFLLAFCGGL